MKTFQIKFNITAESDDGGELDLDSILEAAQAAAAEIVDNLDPYEIEAGFDDNSVSVTEITTKLNSYTAKVVNERLTHYKFSGHGYTLSALDDENQPGQFAEIAIIDEQNEFVPLSAYDSVESVPVSKVNDFLAVLEATEKPRAYFYYYFEEN